MYRRRSVYHRAVKVLDLFSGHGGWSQAFQDRGHEVFRVDWDDYYEAELHIDILRLTATDVPHPDIVLASPPCERFSVARFRHWGLGYRVNPMDYETKQAIRLVKRTMHLIRVLQPHFWVVENPRGMLRRLGLIPGVPVTITQCQYGRPYMKPTDLWGGFPPSLRLKVPCSNGAPCHQRAPRGSRVGTLGVDYDLRSVIPPRLSLAVCRAAEKDLQLFETRRS